MQIVIIEDEIKTAKALGVMIQQIAPDAVIAKTIQSVQGAIDYFNTHEQPALIFMDIQLADGLCFDIFKETEIRAPVIFCTAYDEYALEGFKANGIDYILKPFNQQKLEAAFHKVRQLKQFFGEYTHEEKTSFLVFWQNRYMAIPVDNIAYFYIKLDMPAIHTFDGKEYFIQQSLDNVSTLLSAKQFYRVNRQYLINFKAIKEVVPQLSRKLLVQLQVSVPDPIILNKNNTTAFLQWMGQR